MKYYLLNETDKEILSLGPVVPSQTQEDVDTFFDLNLREDAYFLHRMVSYLYTHPSKQISIKEVRSVPKDYTEVESVE